MMEPQEIEDEEYEQILDRVAAIDVAKASGMVCTRVPHPSRPGKKRTRVWEVSATTGAVLELADHLAGEGIEKVTLESTSDYWRIWYYLLEAAGLSVQLVNARDVKNVPGRPKTDLLTEHSGVPAGHRQGGPLPLMLPTCPGHYLRGHESARAGFATTGSGHTALYHPAAFSSLLLVTPAKERPRRHQTALDLLMHIVHRDGCVSSEKTSSTACGRRS